MTPPWRYQLRIYLPEDLAEAARQGLAAPELQPLAATLDAHDATTVSQLDAFEAYCAEAEKAGVDGFPLYKWTRATLDDAEKRRKHLQAFALRVAGQEVYPKDIADALEAALQPLIDGRHILRTSRHDTNPANNMPVPSEYRS